VFGVPPNTPSPGVQTEGEVLHDNIPAKTKEGMEHSRALVLCKSANAFGSDWAQLDARKF
jgi:hypothetical protein